MRDALEATQVALVLFSEEFFERGATKGELAVLMERHARHRVQLLPVFLRLGVEECKRRMRGVLGEGVRAGS